MTREEPQKRLQPWETPEHLAWIATEQARVAAEAEEAKRRRFIVQRQRQLAAERESRRQKLKRGELVVEPPGAGESPGVVAIVETRLEGILDTPAWVRRKRRETLNILINGALQMAQSGLVLDGTRDRICIAITGMNRRCVMPADGPDGLCILHRPDDAPTA